MKARILKFLNIPGILIIATLLMTIQSTFFTSYPLSFFQPDGVFLILIWISMKREFTEGGIMTLMLGYCMELHSASPRGMYLTNAMIIFLLTHFMYRNFQVKNRKTLVLIGGSLSVLSRLNILFILFLLNKAENEWQYTLRLLMPTAIIHGALIPFVFQFLHKFDIWTLKNPNAEHQHEQDFYLDEEFI